MKITLIILQFLGLVLLTVIHCDASSSIVIDGGKAGTPGGDFSDYSHIPESGDPWEPSSTTNAEVRLSVGQTGANGERTEAGWNKTGYPGPGSEVNFIRGKSIPQNAASAIQHKAYISIQLDSSNLSSKAFFLKSIAVAIWRNGGAAANHYQFAYDVDGDGYDTDDLIGKPQVNNHVGKGRPFRFRREIQASASTQQEVRLYFWHPTGTHAGGNSHLFRVEAEYEMAPYSAIPEPSSNSLLLLLGLSSLIVRRNIKR
ncbi:MULTISPECIES: hypothetical protein [unclassified Lentimonas]|uniref:hypothetical protein n=1 Tax=unclassified Lentimonas TaxID=2630993 RepID=UPI001328AB79|nr:MULTISPECIES: hypothetical protein [unclassified Lentimonas]CAA6680192.1 Unannotated [Lentimonas sp. CC4]CAA6687054.1 Unannotated [Lentimonas sp. CC6]CAA7076172.1 Unannotated [Lentimonas sp. CC4]CAA7171179.1 Unannotated [Lentimonas sp. CC21]CAA7182760.1 Unannotated [Lentimonas sp. CC8]